MTTVADLKRYKVKDALNEAYTVYLKVPVTSLKRKEPGNLFPFNIEEPTLAELALGATQLEILSVEGAAATLAVTVNEEYLTIFNRDLRNAIGVELINEPKEETETSTKE